MYSEEPWKDEDFLELVMIEISVTMKLIIVIILHQYDLV